MDEDQPKEEVQTSDEAAPEPVNDPSAEAQATDEAATNESTEDGANEAAEETEAVPELPQIDKMVNATIEFLHRHNAQGVDGEVGSYDVATITDCCQKILNGAVNADTGYGIVVSRLYYETANLL